MDDSNKPITPVIFTETENIANTKLSMQLQQLFQQQHVEIMSPASNDLAQMIRQEKQMYANMGILFAVQSIAAQNKIKSA